MKKAVIQIPTCLCLGQWLQRTFKKEWSMSTAFLVVLWAQCAAKSCVNLGESGDGKG